jgi:LysM repeat protein
MRSKLYRAALPLSAALLLFTAGCFRQAGEAIAPTVTGAAQVAITRSPALDSAALQPAESTAVIEPVSEPQTSSAPTPAAQASETPQPALPTVALVIFTSTPQYITPQMPLGFTTPDTPAPTVAPVLDTVALTQPSGQPSFILPNSSEIQATPTNLPGVDDPCIHVIQPGDTLYAIAITYGFTVNELLAANPDLGGASAVIQPGDPISLPLPECVDPEATANADDVVPAVTRAAATPLPSATPARADGSQIHVVQPGDVLYNIAVQYGTTVSAIVQANNLSNPNALQVGQELLIPPSN